MKIAFVLPDLSGGGAARVASILCNEWQRMGVNVHLVTFESAGTPGVYTIADAVTRHQIGLSVSPPTTAGFVFHNLQRVRALRRVFSHVRPDSVVSFLLNANVSAVAAARSLGLPIIVSERNHPAHDNSSRLKVKLRALAYPRATRLVVQTEDIRNWFAANLGIDAAVIANPVEPPENLTHEPRLLRGTDGRRRVISLGRLEPQKGFDRLIEAFVRIAAQAPDWDLVIFGEGEERKCLEHLVAEHGLQSRISLPGVTRAARQELRASDLYVHAARYEGYPNAVIEALSEGLCVVATDCPGATGEILQAGVFGILVPDRGPQELAEGLLRAINDDELRQSLAGRAPEAVAALSPHQIALRWIDEFDAILKQSPR